MQQTKMNEMGGYTAAVKPARHPGPHPVVATPDPNMTPDQKRILQQVMSDSYSCGWVHAELDKDMEKG